MTCDIYIIQVLYNFQGTSIQLLESSKPQNWTERYVFCVVHHFHHLLLDSRDAVPETIGVCVKPLHFSYNKSLELLQFIELNRILGVSR